MILKNKLRRITKRIGNSEGQCVAFLSKGAILTWAGGGGGRPSLAPGEEWLLRISPPQNGGIGGTMAL